MMRGVGGPLLCIGDLLSDVGEVDFTEHREGSTTTMPSSSISNSDDRLRPSDLSQLFQENYKQLNESLAGTDHSWTALTLKLCTALETADKLVQSANSNAGSLSENLRALESILKRGDSTVAAAKAIISVLNKNDELTISQTNKEFRPIDQTYGVFLDI